MNEARAGGPTTASVRPERAPAAWHLVAFASELTGDVTPLQLGDRPLVAARLDGRLRVFDATCPHRGAHLGYGGRIDRDCMLCPFHGRRVHLGADGTGEYHVAEHPSVLAGEALFVRFDDGPDLGLGRLLEGLAETHHIVAGFSTAIRVAGEFVVENAFDPEHFRPVHGMIRGPRAMPAKGDDGELIVEAQLVAPGAADWEKDSGGPAVTAYRFHARAYSPNLVITQLGPAGPSPYFFTGTVPTVDGCVARIALAVPHAPGGQPPAAGYLEGMIAGSKEAFREDIPVWEHLAPDHVPRYDLRDRSVLAFREFVDTFRR